MRFNSRLEYGLGRQTASAEKLDRRYDEVAEELFRLNNKINRGGERRKRRVDDNISRCSRQNSVKDERNKAWNVSWRNRAEAAFIKQGEKAKAAKRQIKKAEQARATKTAEYSEEQEARFERFRQNYDVQRHND